MVGKLANYFTSTIIPAASRYALNVDSEKEKQLELEKEQAKLKRVEKLKRKAQLKEAKIKQIEEQRL